MTERLAGCIIAGGQARRMGGGDKGEITLTGQTILARIIARLCPQVAVLGINANGDPARLQTYGLPVFADSFPGHAGPLAGLLAAMGWARAGGFARVLSVSCDTPFLPFDLAERLLAATSAGRVALAQSGGRIHSTTGLWPVSLHDALAADLAAGARKVSAWTPLHSPALVDWPVVPYDPFFNVNRPEDVAEAQRIIEEFKP